MERPQTGRQISGRGRIASMVLFTVNRMNFRAFSWLSAALVVTLAASLTACNDYYIPPPPVSVSLSTSTNATGVALLSQQSDGTFKPGTLQLVATVNNSPDQKVTWKINNGGADVTGGNATLGTIDSSGLYTAPAAMPNPATLLVTAYPEADPTRPSTITIQVYTPLASVTSVTPGAVVAGTDASLNVQGVNFYNTPANGAATVNVSGTKVQSVTFGAAGSDSPSFTNQLTAQVHVNAPGLLQIAVQNPGSAGNTNPISILSQPASPSGSSSIAVLNGTATDSTGATVTGNLAYVPRTTADQVAVVNLDAGTEINHWALPAGFNPAAMAANPAQNTVVAVSDAQTQLAVLDANKGTVLHTWPVAVAGTASFSDGSCAICGIVVDADRNVAVLSTASGYMTVDLNSGAATQVAAIPAGQNASENFSYDPSTQRIYAPWYTGSGAGLNVINVPSKTVQTFSLPSGTSFSLGTQLDAATLDQVTGYGLVADEATGEMTALNLNNQTTGSNSVSAPAAQFAVTTACGGGWEGAAIEPYNHLALFTNNGGCIAAAALPQASATGAPTTPSSVLWSMLGTAAPDGVSWTNAAMPHSATTYLDVNGKSWGLALRQDQAMLVKVDLAGLIAGPAAASAADAHQVDPSKVVTYIPLQ